MKKLVLLASALIVLSSPVNAGEASFEKADANHDGVLSSAEAMMVLSRIWDEMTKVSRASGGGAYATDRATGLRYTEDSQKKMSISLDRVNLWYVQKAADAHGEKFPLKVSEDYKDDVLTRVEYMHTGTQRFIVSDKDKNAALSPAEFKIFMGG